MIEFYNRDCLEALKEYPDKAFDLAIVDPPYEGKDAIGIKDCKTEGLQLAKRKNYHLFDNKAPTDKYFYELFRVSKQQIIWGGNFFGLKGGYICWDKKATAFGRGELAYCSKIMSVNVFEYTWNGFIQQDMQEKEQRIHPTQKPVGLLEQMILEFTNENDVILDLYGGGGVH